MSIFIFITNTNENWRNEGIIDEDLESHIDNGSNDYERTTIKNINLELYLNLAASYLKLKDFSNAL